MSAFPTEVPPSPEKIGDIVVTLYDPNPEGEGTQAANVSIQVLMGDGTVKIKQFPLAPHVSTTVMNQLKSLMANLRTKANTEILT